MVSMRIDDNRTSYSGESTKLSQVYSHPNMLFGEDENGDPLTDNESDDEVTENMVTMTETRYSTNMGVLLTHTRLV